MMPTNIRIGCWAVFWVRVFGYHDKAIAAYRRALELNPNFLIALGSLGTVLALAGRAEESIRNSETCIRLNPREPGNFFRFSGIALAYFVAQDYVKAREWSEKAVQRKRDWWQGHALLAVSCALLGEQDEAQAAIGDWLLAIPGATLEQFTTNTVPKCNGHGTFPRRPSQGGSPGMTQ